MFKQPASYEETFEECCSCAFYRLARPI